jgi:hypothetical protein
MEHQCTITKLATERVVVVEPLKGWECDNGCMRENLEVYMSKLGIVACRWGNGPSVSLMIYDQSALRWIYFGLMIAMRYTSMNRASLMASTRMSPALDDSGWCSSNRSWQCDDCFLSWNHHHRLSENMSILNNAQNFQADNSTFNNVGGSQTNNTITGGDHTNNTITIINPPVPAGKAIFVYR